MGVIRCPKHGLSGIQPGCDCFFQAVDSRSSLELWVRWDHWGGPFLLCPVCTALVDADRGFVPANTRSNVGVEVHSEDARCAPCVLEWYEATAPKGRLLTWMRRRYLD